MRTRDDVRSASRPGSSQPGHRTVHTRESAPAYSTPSPTGITYLREARRLRQRYAGQPDMLHASLRELSRKHDRANRMTTEPAAPAEPKARSAVCATVARVRPVPAEADSPSFGKAVVNWFADRVAQTVDSRLLMFSERHALLKTAERLGIDRFHANLIVAVAQHQAEERGTVQAKPTAARGKWPVGPVMLIALVQSLILSAGWWILH